MGSGSMADMRNFSARETAWLQELDGIELAPFWRRAFALLLDVILILLIIVPVMVFGVWVYLKIQEANGHAVAHADFNLGPGKFELKSADPALNARVESEWLRLLTNIGLPILYFGLLTWQGEGRSPGKRLLRIRVVSLVHRHLSLWHSVERALGYGAAALEGGFGFLQFFLHPNRCCVQDRIAETIVVTERGYRRLHEPKAAELSSTDLSPSTDDEPPATAPQSSSIISST